MPVYSKKNFEITISRNNEQMTKKKEQARPCMRGLELTNISPVLLRKVFHELDLNLKCGLVPLVESLAGKRMAVPASTPLV